ncbi:MAG TPA: MobF family relaxase [Solirubrobacterales bacterium]|nr:MobF family relaxase [Solirubrobacterales bacterium]
MVGVTKIGRRNANYWIQAVAEGGDDYYSKPGEAPGQWKGGLAAELGLHGEVDRDAYAALLAGKNPVTGEALLRRPEPRVFVDASGRTRQKEPILGYDIRFSAPKSVSVLWAVGSPDLQLAIERSFDQAVEAGVSYLEAHACYVQRGKGGVEIEPGEGFLSMSFLHRSSRAGDPALHAHVVTANMTRAEADGKWLSLANPKSQSPLLAEAKSAGFVFQAVLRETLTREIGATWKPVVNGYADLEWVADSVLEHFSRRRAEIVAEMAQRGTSSPSAAEVAAYRTREAKECDVDPDTQRSGWRAQAAEFDLTPGRIDEWLRAAAPREPRPLDAKRISAAVEGLEATRSHFDRRELLCGIAEQMGEGASLDQLEEAVTAAISSPRLTEIHRGKEPLGASYYSTPRLLAMEERILQSAVAGKGASATVPPDTLAAVLDRHRYLSAEQMEMVRRITTGGERIVVVSARPGTGKTTALSAAREAWAEAGIPGIGVATARSASGELHDAGVPSMSITALRIRGEEAIAAGKRPLPPHTVVVMDESSTTSTLDMHFLVELVDRCGGQLVCIGDTRQIGAVGPGGLYGRLATVTDAIELNEIRRQRDPRDRRIVELAHEGRGSDAIDLLRASERLLIADTHEQALDALALNWHQSFQDGEDAVMIARRVRDVADLNERARELLAAEGHLGEMTVEVAGQEFAVGDRIITRANSKNVSNRERWEVVGVDSTQTHLQLQRIGGDERSVILTPRYLERVTDNGEPSIQHAYALTTYATESKTFDTAHALLDPGISREDFLVAVSRARGHTTAFGVAASEFLDADLGPATREVLDEAHDIRTGSERVASEFSASEVPERKHMDRLAPHELAARRAELVGKLDAGDRDPTDGRREMISNRLAETRERLKEIATSEAELLAQPQPDPDELSLLQTTARMTTRQVDRLETDLAALPARTSSPTRPEPLSTDERVELSHIEDRLLQLRRREVGAERIEPSQMIVDAIGPRPQDPVKIAAWNEGVDLIVGYRQLNNITEQGGHVLGPMPGDAAARQARREAELRLQAVQQTLALERARQAERSASLTR